MRQNHLSPALLCGVAAAVPAACAAQQGAGGRESGRPNIVYIMTDDHAYQTVGAYGHPISRLAPTPNIDRLAREGMLFREAFVENSISAPSRATLLTGVYSHRHGQTTLSYGIMDTTLVHFPELLRAEGYRTAIFGKWHLSIEPKGFDHYDLLWDQGEYYNPVMRTPETGGRYVRQEGYATDIITDHALAWLDGHRDDDAPFCLMIHHKAPHRNWMADLKYLDLYEDVEFPEPETLFDDYATRGDQMRQQQLTIDRHMGYAFDFKVEELKDEPTLQYIHDSWDIAMSTLTPEQRRVWDDSYGRKNRDFLADRPEGKELLRWKYQRYIHDYCRTIRSVDDQIGRVLDYLEESGLMDNTLIVYTSDQGFLLGEHGLYDKRFMYEESFRTPLIMAWRGHIRPGTGLPGAGAEYRLCPDAARRRRRRGPGRNGRRFAATPVPQRKGARLADVALLPVLRLSRRRQRACALRHPDRSLQTDPLVRSGGGRRPRHRLLGAVRPAERSLRGA